MASAPKLTKKQKKAIAYREGKGTRKNAVEDDVDKSKGFDVEEDAEMESGTVLPEKKGKDAAAKKDKGKGKAVDVAANKKRKRDSDAGVEESEEIEQDAPKKKKKANDEKQRFILFVGQSPTYQYMNATLILLCR